MILNKQKIINRHGKIGVEGCSNYAEEMTALQKKAYKSVLKQNQFEKDNVHVQIPINQGILLVPREKYLKNKEHYDSIFDK